MSLSTRTELATEELERKSSLEKRGVELTLGDLKDVAKRILMEDAYRDEEWVMYDGRPITNIELMLRELIAHKQWRPKLAVLELIFGKAAATQKVEGGVEVIFKVEHDEDWYTEAELLEDGEYTVE